MTRLRVLLIRHGESHNNVLLGRSREAYRKERMADPPLSERGKLQAENAALFLSIRDADSVSKRNVIFSFRIHTHISLFTNLHAHYQYRFNREDR